MTLPISPTVYRQNFYRRVQNPINSSVIPNLVSWFGKRSIKFHPATRTTFIPAFKLKNRTNWLNSASSPAFLLLFFGTIGLVPCHQAALSSPDAYCCYHPHCLFPKTDNVLPIPLKSNQNKELPVINSVTNADSCLALQTTLASGSWPSQRKEGRPG